MSAKAVPNGTRVKFRDHHSLDFDLHGLYGTIEGSYSYGTKVRYTISVDVGGFSSHHVRSDFQIIKQEG